MSENSNQPEEKQRGALIWPKQPLSEPLPDKNTDIGTAQRVTEKADGSIRIKRTSGEPESVDKPPMI